MRLFYLFILVLFSLHSNEKTRSEILKEESEKFLARGLSLAAQFYALDEGEDWREITDAILQSEMTDESIKRLIQATQRRFFLFRYPSDGFQVKGILSFVSPENPLLIFLRGGNRFLGLMHPANDFTCMRNYTILMTTYRGGVSEGVDEFGGAEVSDVDNLIAYFPILQAKLGLEFEPKKIFMLGGSRGGMEMFLTLSRNPQYQVDKAASLSGLLELRACMAYRPDMRAMFIREFGLIPEENEEEWIRLRNPVANAKSLRKDLPILILQGTHDLRISLNEGLNMVSSLTESPVTYLEIPGGDHCLNNYPGRIDLIADWFEE